jgi:hypothetical protein
MAAETGNRKPRKGNPHRPKPDICGESFLERTVTLGCTLAQHEGDISSGTPSNIMEGCRLLMHFILSPSTGRSDGGTCHSPKPGQEQCSLKLKPPEKPQMCCLPSFTLCSVSPPTERTLDTPHKDLIKVTPGHPVACRCFT